jgi:ATP-dependent helicase/nuclease subunit A
MSRRLKPLPILEGDQRQASDPTAHAALSASAGTGKTQVLTARVLRLLLGGVDPAAILCLTFTKAGAAEMANRIGERLAAWVRMDDVGLRHDLFALGEDNDPLALQRARRLFARVLETPGGLRIQTIHGFAQTLLASFPAEAGINPGFAPIEGRAEAELIRRTLATLLADAEASGKEALIADVQALSLRLGEGGAEDYLKTCARAEEAIGSLGDPASFEAALLALIGISGSAEAGIAALLTDAEIDVPTIEQLIEVNREWGTKTAQTIVANLAQFLAASPAERGGLLDTIGKGLVTTKDEPCKATSGQVKILSDYAELLSEFAHWLVTIRRLRRAAALAAVQAAGLRAGQAFARAYRAAKRTAGVADFDDLIVWTRRLLGIDGMGEWVRFKLDQRTDHILVDEAQDTNADQWAIVDSIAEEYFSGQSETDARWRTLFMVGDFKQAIFGFQGTDPRQFEEFRRSVAERAALAGEAALDSDAWAREFRDLSIDASFRSSPAVLEVVDALIDEVGHTAMGLPQRPNPHGAAHGDRPGEVLWWPPFEPPELDDDDGDPGEEGWVAEPVRLYADALARQVRTWLDEAAPMASTERPLCAGDILILVRSRSELASLLVARLYAHNVPVAGIDRLHLSKPLAVKDLLAAIAFAVQPNDDLNLGGLLVSPIIGLVQDALFDLAHTRKGSLWSALQARRDDPAFSAAHATLADLLQRADFVTPARFLEALLSGPTDARRKLLERLGEAARDPIEELVASALEFEQQEGASLDRFLAWFSRGDVEVKRDPASAGNAVRVMTVHGAKGLEAPLVILADATHDPARVGRHPQSIDLPIAGHDVPLLRPRANELVQPYAALDEARKAADLEEHWRLLYVGLTRAAERLVITGVKGRGEVAANSWHSRTATALTALGAQPIITGAWRGGLRWQGSVPTGTRRLRAGRRHLAPPTLPAWVREQAPAEERPPRPLAPSSIVADTEALAPPSPEQRAAATRGSLLHALFERLPAVAAPDRRPMALRWLERAGETDPARRDEIATAALAVIDDDRFADLFTPDALAEAPIAATLPDGRVIAGTVDRLCIGDSLVRVIDFKTGRAVPSGPANVPPAHIAQMSAYVAALEVIFPGRRVEAALLYTAGPKLVVLPG